MSSESDQIVSVWDNIVPKSLTCCIMDSSSEEIRNTIVNAKTHYYKALKLKDIDNEMAAIRFIASLEEMVVAVYKLAIINVAISKSNIQFAKNIKNHYVKQALLPVAAIFFIIIETFDGKVYSRDGSQDLEYKMTVKNNKIVLEVYDNAGNLLTDKNIFSDLYLTSGAIENPKEASSQIFESLENICINEHHATIKEYLSSTVQFRNKLLYSDGKPMPKMKQSFDELIDEVNVFVIPLNWMIGVLLDPELSSKIGNLINQFIDVYKITLEKCDIIKIK